MLKLWNIFLDKIAKIFKIVKKEKFKKKSENLKKICLCTS